MTVDNDNLDRIRGAVMQLQRPPDKGPPGVVNAVFGPGVTDFAGVGGSDDDLAAIIAAIDMAGESKTDSDVVTVPPRSKVVFLSLIVS